MIHHGDCLEVMAAMPAASVDAVVTDPPYGLGFMGKHWDHGVPAVEFWAEMLRVAKPSAYLLSFAGTRTVHRIGTAIEDAGWIIRDCLVWAYAQGFPKSRALLKPAWEPIVMARKPGPLRELNIDECRIPTTQDERDWIEKTARPNSRGVLRAPSAVEYAPAVAQVNVHEAGRWPANVILTDPIFDGDVEGVVGGGETASGLMRSGQPRKPAVEAGKVAYGTFGGDTTPVDTYGDTGTYSRFFLIPKATRSEREPVFGGLDERERRLREAGRFHSGGRTLIDGAWHETGSTPTSRRNHHPTVKPVDLMRHLIRLVTPPGGIVLDPFLGSGTTAIAAEMEGFDWIGIEREAEYVAIAEARLQGVQRGLGLAAE